MKPRIYADFHNLDDENRVCLRSVGSKEDIAQLGLQLEDGLEITLYTDDADDLGQLDDLLADGVVRSSADAHGWVVEVDWDSIRHASEAAPAVGLNGSVSQTGRRETV